MKTIPMRLAVLILAVVAGGNYGCSTSKQAGNTISEPAGAAIYRDGEWKPVDTSRFRQVPSNRTSGYYDDSGIWHPVPQ